MDICPDQGCRHRAAAKARWAGLDRDQRRERTEQARTQAAAGLNAQFVAEADAAGITDPTVRAAYIKRLRTEHFRQLATRATQKRRADRLARLRAEAEAADAAAGQPEGEAA